ncbi:unnamed protein product [Rhizophagus irregularis]|nr:unnamed protein product [Rhizophagus irregularis]
MIVFLEKDFGGLLWTMVLQIVSGVTSSAALEIYKNHQLRLLKGHQQILSFGWAFKERKRTKIRKVLMGF